MEVLIQGSLAVGRMKVGKIVDENGQKYLIDSKSKEIKIPIFAESAAKVKKGDVIECLVDYEKNMKNIIKTLLIIRLKDNNIIEGEENGAWHRYYNCMKKRK